MVGKRILQGLVYNDRQRPDPGDKFGDLGDKSKIPENAILFSISLLGEEIRFNISSLEATCPPCKERNGEKEYCVKSGGGTSTVCVKAHSKGERCCKEPDARGVYDRLPPCKEGLTCNDIMGGRCE
uniref:Uncharacterized protein n=2 Tax=Araneus ventricosus TaxID=182803 RepID=A0A4Y2SAD6_ARAVE|nr:hypothetical protein AVEN_83343-1 [Araneus ventricosus]